MVLSPLFTLPLRGKATGAVTQSVLRPEQFCPGRSYRWMMAASGAGLPAPLNFFVAPSCSVAEAAGTENRGRTPLLRIRLTASFRGKPQRRQGARVVEALKCETMRV